jgi:hypothetical protein
MLLKKVYQKSPTGNHLIFANSKGEQLMKVNNTFCSLSGDLVVNYPEPPVGFEPVVIGVEVKRGPTQDNIKFTPKMVDMGKKQGWLTESEDSIFIRDFYDAVPTRFKIKSYPGRYCLRTGVKLKDDPQGKHARKYVEENYDGKPTDLPGDNSGYVCNNYYLVSMEK